MLWAILNLVILIATIFFVMAACVFGPKVLGYGFRNYPKMTGMIVVLAVLAIIIAALTFGRLFPQCHVMLGFGQKILC